MGDWVIQCEPWKIIIQRHFLRIFEFQKSKECKKSGKKPTHLHLNEPCFSKEKVFWALFYKKGNFQPSNGHLNCLPQRYNDVDKLCKAELSKFLGANSSMRVRKWAVVK